MKGPGVLGSVFRRGTRGASARLMACAVLLLPCAAARGQGADELYPKHVNARTLKAVKAGLDFLAQSQGQDGNWGGPDGQQYPVSMASLAGMAFLANGNTPSRGEYADQVRKTMRYVMSNAQTSGLITSTVEFNGRSMYSHGFSLLFLSSVYGMENDERNRERLRKIITAGIDLTARAQSVPGGWTYTPGGGDEGSVTVTQMQGLRAAQNAGFTVPKSTVEKAVQYLEKCKTPEGGIRYSFGGPPTPQLAISAASIATLYNAGQYDSPLAESCLKFVWDHFQQQRGGWDKGGGHSYYTHLYAAQAYYQAGDKYWDDYFPGARDQLIQLQAKDGSWAGDGIGQTYGTSIALIILQLPYKFLPIYQR